MWKVFPAAPLGTDLEKLPVPAESKEIVPATFGFLRPRKTEEQDVLEKPVLPL